MKDVKEKRQKEQKIVGEMITLYCKKNHSDYKKGQICPVCGKLLDYAAQRSEHCPFAEQKTFCSNCRIHCYKQEMREQIQAVMRFSGPRMLLYHPVLAVWHVICSISEKRNRVRELRK